MAKKFGWLEGLIVVAALTTAAIHLFLGIRFADVLFLLNSVGFVGLTAAYLLPWRFLDRFRQLARWALVGYSLLTIVMWAVMNGKPDAVGLTAKAAEVVLILALIFGPKKR